MKLSHNEKIYAVRVMIKLITRYLTIYDIMTDNLSSLPIRISVLSVYQKDSKLHNR